MLKQYEITFIKKPDITDLAGEKVMIDFDSGKYFMLTGAANDIWDLMETNSNTAQIVSKLTDIYDIDEQTCYNEVIAFLNTLSEIGFISLKETV